MRSGLLLLGLGHGVQLGCVEKDPDTESDTGTDADTTEDGCEATLYSYPSTEFNLLGASSELGWATLGPDQHCTRWSPDGGLEVMPAALSACPWNIGDSGAMVGLTENWEVVRWDGSTVETLLPSDETEDIWRLRGLNGAASMVAFEGRGWPRLWTEDQGLVELNGEGTYYLAGFDMLSRDGRTIAASRTGEILVWRDMVLTSYDTPPEYPSGFGVRVSPGGTAIGATFWHGPGGEDLACTWDSPTPTCTPLPGEWGGVTDVADDGTMVGYYFITDDSRRAWLWQPQGEFVNLDEACPGVFEGWDLPRLGWISISADATRLLVGLQSETASALVVLPWPVGE